MSDREIRVHGFSTGIVAALLLFILVYSEKVDCAMGIEAACAKIEASYHND